MQRKLILYLNALYHFEQSEAAHGFVCKVKGQTPHKSIYTNAKAHLGNGHLLNIDFQDFFHQISKEAIAQVFSNSPFCLNKEAAFLLARICTYNGRLPMGAPTSPVLSNFYTLQLDEDLSSWAQDNKARYTRYVDDLSFSSKIEAFDHTSVLEITEIAKAHNLSFNPDKIKLFGPNDVKTITGLVLNDSVDIDPLYYEELDKDLLRLQSLLEVATITGNVHSASLIKTFKQEVMGKINFVATIEGYCSNQYKSYLEQFHLALNPPEDLVLRWTRFSNYN